MCIQASSPDLVVMLYMYVVLILVRLGSRRRAKGEGGACEWCVEGDLQVQRMSTSTRTARGETAGLEDW